MGLFKKREKIELRTEGSKKFTQQSSEYLEFVRSLGPDADPKDVRNLLAFQRAKKARSGGEKVAKSELDYYMAENGSLWESEEAYRKFLEKSGEEDTVGTESEKPAGAEASEGEAWEDDDDYQAILDGLREPSSAESTKYVDPEGREWESEEAYLLDLQRQLKLSKEADSEEEIAAHATPYIDSEGKKWESQDAYLEHLQEELGPQTEEMTTEEPVDADTEVALRAAAEAIQTGAIPNPEVVETVLTPLEEPVDSKDDVETLVPTSEEPVAEEGEQSTEEEAVSEEDVETLVPASEEPVVEEAEQPAEEVVLEEPAPAESGVEEPTPVSEEPAVEEGEQPVEEATLEEPAATESDVEVLAPASEGPAVEEMEQPSEGIVDEQPIAPEVAATESVEDMPVVEGYIDKDGNEWENEAAYLAHQAEISHLADSALERTESIGGEEMEKPVAEQEDKSLSSMVSQVMELNKVNEARQQYLASLQKTNNDLKAMIALLTQQQQAVEEEIATLVK